MITILFTVCLLWLLIQSIYRVTLHPLAKLPGPYLAAITDWSTWLQVAKGRQHLYLQYLHEKYGDVVRVGPNRLSFRTVQAVHDIYVDRKANQVKTGFAHTLLKIADIRDLQSIIEPQVYAQRRRAVAHCFSDEALRSAEGYMLDRIRQWCNILGEGCNDSPDGWSKQRNIKPWTQYMMLDILGDLCFGRSFDALKNGFHPLPGISDEGVKLMTLLTNMPLGPICIFLLNRVQKLAKMLNLDGGNAVADYHHMQEEYVGERLAEEQKMAEKPSYDQRHDFFHYLREAKDPETGHRLTRQELTNEAGVLVGAGYDTSSANIDACLWYLTRNVEKLDLVQSQIREAFKDVEEIRAGSLLSSQTYLRACLEESLRMTPAAPGVLDRLALKGGMNIDGLHVPAGTTVTVPIYVIHHNEDYYPDAWTFKPERWIASDNGSGETSKEEVATARKAFFAFSAGARVCIGRNMAYMDMMIALGRLLYLYDIRLASDVSDGAGDPSTPAWQGRHRPQEYQIEDWFLNRRTGTKLQFKLRENV